MLNGKNATLDGLALLVWGILLLKYGFTGQYRLLIHPNYFVLVMATGVVLIVLGIIKILTIVTGKHKNSATAHITLFPPGLGSTILLVVAIAGLLIPPKILYSQTAMQRGVSELPLTRSQPQAFRTTTKPETRSLIDWIRTINAYPEPDAYSGQAANISGFVLHLPELPDNYLMLSRFVITCCAVDAYPIGLPVKLSVSRNNYPADTWLEIKGEMITETLPRKDSMDAKISNKRSLVIAAKSIQPIPTPNDPYNFQ
ncbi:MAG: TIGR03943 family putative permease subunit [Waterburya sp.]